MKAPNKVVSCVKAFNKVVTYLALVVMGVILALDSFFLKRLLGARRLWGVSLAPLLPQTHPQNTPNTPPKNLAGVHYGSLTGQCQCLGVFMDFFGSILGCFPRVVGVILQDGGGRPNGAQQLRGYCPLPPRACDPRILEISTIIFKRLYAAET